MRVYFNPVYPNIASRAYNSNMSFGRNRKILSPKQAQTYVDKYKASTSGYRGELNKDFNDKFVYTMTQAASQYMTKHKTEENPVTMIGGDTRKATVKYAPQIADIMEKNGINIFYPQENDKLLPVASPVLAVSANSYNIPLSVLLTASHNPWTDGGYNFITQDGMVAENTQTDEIAQYILDIAQTGENPINNTQRGKKLLFNPYKEYKNYIDKKGLIDFDNIKQAGIDIYYEDLCGTGRFYYPRLMSDHGIELKGVISTKTDGPNPTEENLYNLGQLVKNSSNPLRIGLATDGDSDRFGVVDENGNFLDANDVLMLCAYHLIKNKGMTQGTIIKNHSTSDKLEELAKYFNKRGYDIDVQPTPVGFKYLGGEMLKLEDTPKKAILAGESSGGLSIRGHLPEKDGFIAISTIADLVATEKKPIGQILKQVNSLLDKNFISETINIRFPSEEEKTEAVEIFAPYAQGLKDNLFGYKIDKEKTVMHNKKIKTYKQDGDGYKIYLENNSSILVRKSGTEPIMRYFIDSCSEKVFNNLKTNLLNFARGSNGEITS